VTCILIGVDATARSEDATVIASDVYGAPAMMAGPSYMVVAGDIEADIRRDVEATLGAPTWPPKASCSKAARGAG
jgi:hypothetical protein